VKAEQRYEAPRCMRLSDMGTGIGQTSCQGSGSNASACNTSGSTATGSCKDAGNSVGAACVSPGSSPVQ
jgi:hypothetical protein